MFWTCNEVMAITKGYFDVMYPIVQDAVQKAEDRSMKLVWSSKGLSKEKFAGELNKNALQIFDDWKQLYVKLLTKFDAGEGVRYEKLPDPHTPDKY